MSTYTTMFRRGGLCFVALLFAIVPLVSQAVTFPKTTDPIYTILGIKLWLTSGTQTIPQTPGVPVTISRGVDFTVNWQAVGKTTTSEIKAVGITCKNNWGTNTASSGFQTGSVLAGRDFIITCSGLGASKSAQFSVRTSLPDITVSTFYLSGLHPTAVPGVYTAPDGENFSFRTSLKNIGNASTATLFKVQYFIAHNREMTLGPVPKGSQDVDGIGSLAIKPLTEKPTSYAFLVDPEPWYFQACADSPNAVPESIESNNCSPVRGPLKFVLP